MKLLWELYPFFYERIRDFKPYEDLLTEVERALDVKEIGKYLDLGCGTGEFLYKIGVKHPNLSLYGIDISKISLKLAQRKCSSLKNLKFYLHDITKGLPFPDSFFNGVVSIHLLNYLPKSSLFTYFNECYRVLKPKGKLVITNIERFSVRKSDDGYKNIVKEIDLTSLPFYLWIGLFNLPMKLGRNIHYYNSKCIKKLMERMGFNVEILQGVYLGSTSILKGEKLKASKD